MRAVARAESGQLAVGFLGSSVVWIAPALVRAWREQRPGVRLAVEEIDLRADLSALASGRIDLAFVRGPDLAPFRHEEVARDQLCVVLPPGHPLTGRSRLRLADLAEESWISFEGYEDFLLDQATPAGFVPRVAESATTAQTYLAAVAAGVGLGLMPASARGLGSADLDWVPLEGQTLSMIMAWRDEAESPTLLALLALARKTVGGGDSSRYAINQAAK